MFGPTSWTTTSWAAPAGNRSSWRTSSPISGTSCRPTSRSGTRSSRSFSSSSASASSTRARCAPRSAVSFAWVLGIWVIGEGLGMLLTGNATALTGAPGSVLLYGLIGLMAWPRPPRRFAVDWSDRPSGVSTSAAAQGIGGTITPLAVWAGYWWSGRRAVPAARQPDPDLHSERHLGHDRRGARLVRPLPHQRRPTSSRPPGPRRLGSWPPCRSPSGSVRWSPADPAGSSPLGRCCPS